MRQIGRAIEPYASRSGDILESFTLRKGLLIFA